MREIITIMGGKRDDRQVLIDAAHAAVARAKTICAEAEIACQRAQSVLPFRLRER